MNRIEKLRKVVRDKQCATIEGHLIDTFTASAILACYDGTQNEHTKTIIMNHNLHEVAILALTITGKT